MTALIDPHTFAGTAPPPPPSAVAPTFLSPEDFAGIPQPASPPAPQPDMKVIGIGDGGVPIFAEPKQNAELAQNMGDYNARVSEKGLEGATFGLAPYAEAPIVSAVKGVPLSEGLKTAREYTAETSKKYPGSSMVAEGIGMSVPTIATAGLINPAESVVGRAAQAGDVGGLTGGGAAAGHDVGSGQTDHIIRDTAVGTGVGAGLGAGTSLVGDFVRPVIDWVARKFSPEAANSQAIQRIAQRISQDQKAGGPSAQDMLDALDAAGSEPHTIADVGGNNVLGEAGRVARAPGPGKQTAISTLTARDAAEGKNLANVTGANISGGGSAYSAAKALDQARARASAPLYDKAFSESSPIDVSPIIQKLDAQIAEAKGGIKSALQKARSYLLDANGNPDVSLAGLHQSKLAIDDLINGASDSPIGNNAKRLLVQTKNRLLDAMDKASTGPDGVSLYGQARSAYSGPSQSMDALEAGTKILKKRPEEVADDIANLSPGDKEFYKLGAADTLITNLSKSGRNANEANSVSRNDYMRQQLRPLFDSDADYQKFIGAVERANRRFETKYQTIGNSATAGRVAEDDTRGHGTSPLANLAETGVGLVTGEKFPFFQGAINFARGLGGNRAPQSPEVNAAISRMLFETNPANRAQIMGRILQQMNAGRPVGRLVGPSVAGTLGGGGYPSLFPTSPALIGQALSGPAQ